MLTTRSNVIKLLPAARHTSERWGCSRIAVFLPMSMPLDLVVKDCPDFALLASASLMGARPQGKGMPQESFVQNISQARHKLTRQSAVRASCCWFSAQAA